MNRLILLAATVVLSTGVMLGQNSPATDTGQPNAAPDQTQHGTQANPQATPPIVPHQRPDTTANPDRPEAAPESTAPGTRLPNTTIDDQQPGTSTTPSSSMGTTGSTPGTEPSAEPSAEGNKNGTTPDDKRMPPETKPTEPHEISPSGSSNPSSSANGASSNDTSGTSPHPDNSTDSTNPQTTPPHLATHTPDAGTVMNPASVELVTETAERH